MEKQFVTFNIYNEDYAVDILSVQEIIRATEITKVPKVQESIEGVINLRGRVIPVVNLRKKFGFSDKALDAVSRIIVLNVDGIIIGVIVDSVSEVLRISSDLIEPPPLSAGISSDYIMGIAKLKDRLIMILDINRLLSDEKVNVIENG